MDINVLGYGKMAKQIAALFFLGGHDVTIWNYRKVEDVEVRRQIKLVNKFIGSEKQGSVNLVSCLGELKDHFTIESVVEDIDVKKDLFNSLCSRITKGYFTNSSSYSPNEIGDSVGGLHFYNPIMIKIVELYKPEHINSDEIFQVTDYLTSSGYEVVPVKNNRGYIGNYILFNEISSVLKLIEKNNYNPKHITSVYDNLYEGRNIFNIIDIIGVDVVLRILQNLKEDDDSMYIPLCFQDAIDRNILGKKNKTSICSVFKSLA